MGFKVFCACGLDWWFDWYSMNSRTICYMKQWLPWNDLGFTVYMSVCVCVCVYNCFRNFSNWISQRISFWALLNVHVFFSVWFWYKQSYILPVHTLRIYTEFMSKFTVETDIFARGLRVRVRCHSLLFGQSAELNRN